MSLKLRFGFFLAASRVESASPAVADAQDTNNGWLKTQLHYPDDYAAEFDDVAKTIFFCFQSSVSEDHS